MISSINGGVDMNKVPSENTENKKDTAKEEKDLGVDQDEQVMNGSYGMLETEEEDKKH